ncbi:MAG TPA: DUF2270 domain-containing protein [Candidatus Krumholzibacteria bacterium]|nr:DUF2270 domain-containing protein [Candidatus Krumholzibacteria bacterium]HPD72991.1 DUF2270 domain-containing protein [Candidatus Krumholzibacteria bacterium]HRY41790.1 DUF2270 domain-containing protein [Candidatus Krumholzibacteria bacterium]
MDERKQPFPDFEGQPLLRGEYITAMAHLYRGELQRSLSWRLRLDTTTNWAIFTTAGILSFAFNRPEYAAQTLLAGMYANLLFLILEAQRFRFFDVFHSRLRMIEENFYGPLLRRDLTSPMVDWGLCVADDLFTPRFHLSLRQAIRSRLGRVYAPLFVALIAGWVLVVVLQRRAAGENWFEILAIGRVPGWVPALLVVGLFVYLLVCVTTAPPVPSLPEAYRTGGKRETAREVPDIDA